MRISGDSARRRRRWGVVHRRRSKIALTSGGAGKITGALEFYSKVARESPDTDEGRKAAARVAALRRARDRFEGLSPIESSMIDAQ